MRDAHGETALTVASEEGDPKVVKLLLDKGANINAQQNDGHTALMAAIRAGHIESVKLLLSRGADVNAEAQDSVTALKWAYDGIGRPSSRF